MRREVAAPVAVAVMAAGWGAGFGWLAVQRHLAGGSHAEDLGFTDQILNNFLHGQWFRMSIYQGATWNTELDIGRIPRPDSLLAFHVEPMLLLLVPIYAIGGGAVWLLLIQALALASGAIPAYRLARHVSHSTAAGLAVSAAYLLSPLGQWAALADFHTSTLAPPLLLLSVERLVVKGSPKQALTAAVLALTAREDVGPAVAALGIAVILEYRRARPTGIALTAAGVAWTIASAAVIRGYSGGASPFEVRYGPTLGAGWTSALEALTRPAVLDYAQTLTLSGGWLGLLAPLALLPALPSLALNALSTSPWMAAGKAHYSGLVLPFIILGAAAGLWRLCHNPRLVRIASLGLIVTSLFGYLLEGAGPFGGNYAPAVVDDHARRAAAIAASLPPDATISASSALVPRVSSRAGVYLFPAVLDADYIFLDLKASPAPTSAGDVFLRVQDLVASVDWQVQRAEDGLLVLQRAGESTPTETSVMRNGGDLGSSEVRPVTTLSSDVPPVTALSSGLPAVRAARPREVPPVTLLSADLVPSPDGAIDVDGPRSILRTTWRAERPLRPGTRLEFWVDLENGQRLHLWDVASLWWNPPERWAPGQPVTVDVPDVPARKFHSWQAAWTDSG